MKAEPLFETSVLMDNIGDTLFQLGVINKSQTLAVEQCFQRDQYRDVINWLKDLFKVNVVYQSSGKLIDSHTIKSNTSVTLVIPLSKLTIDDEHRVVWDTSKVLKSKQSYKSIW